MRLRLAGAGKGQMQFDLCRRGRNPRRLGRGESHLARVPTVVLKDSLEVVIQIIDQARHSAKIGPQRHKVEAERTGIRIGWSLKPMRLDPFKKLHLRLAKAVDRLHRVAYAE